MFERRSTLPEFAYETNAVQSNRCKCRERLSVAPPDNNNHFGIVIGWSVRIWDEKFILPIRFSLRAERALENVK